MTTPPLKPGELAGFPPEDVAFSCKCGKPLGIEPGFRRRVTITCPGCKRRLRVTAWVTVVVEKPTPAPGGAND